MTQITPGQRVRIVRSAQTGGWCVMETSVLRYQVGQALSVEREEWEGQIVSEHATIQFPDHGRDRKNLFRCATHYLQPVINRAP